MTRWLALLGLVVAGCTVDFPARWLVDGGAPDDLGSGAEQATADLPSPVDGLPSDRPLTSDGPVSADGPRPDQAPLPDGGSTCPAACKNNCSGGVCDLECSSGCTCPAGLSCTVNCGKGGCNGSITCGTGHCTVNCGQGGCSGDIDCSASCGCGVACGVGGCQGSILCPAACSACLDNSGCDNCP